MSDDFPLKNHALKYFSIESIFHWKPILKKENLHEYEHEPQKDNVFNFWNFAIRLVKCYQIYEDDLNSALDIISDLDADALNWSKNKKEDLFAKMKEAYIHIIFACKMYLLQKNPQQVAKIIDKITPIDDMDNGNKAAIYAVRSAVLILCSNEGIEKAIIYIDKALNIDPDNVQWISLKAFYLRRLRENINRIEPPSMMEKELFEAAYKKDPTNVVFKLQVADMYVELSEHILRQSPDQYDYVFPNNISLNDHTRFEADSKITKAVEHYENSSKKYPENSYVLFCCAKGFIRLPSPHKNIELARTLLNEGLKRNPKSITGHLTMALLLEEYDENIKKAKWHLEICQKLKSFDAELAMIRIMHKEEDSAAYGFKTLQALAERFKEKLQLAVIYTQMVSFYLFIKYDLIKACHYTEKFYQLNSSSTCMRIHRSIFLDYPTPFCLIDVLMDEIKYKKRTPRSPESIRQICEDFEIFMCYQNVPIVSGLPQNLRWKVLQGKPIDSKPLNKFPDNRNTYSKGEFKKYDTDQPNNRYIANRLRRTDSINEFRGAFENNRPQNGNKFSYQDQQKRNNMENNHYKNDFPYDNKNYRSRMSPNESTYPPRFTPSFCAPLLERPRPAPSAEKNSVQKEESPESESTPLIEKPPKEAAKTYSSSSNAETDDEKLVKMILKSLKKIKAVRDKKSKTSNSHRKSSSSSSESESTGVKVTKELQCVEKRSSRKKEYYSESDSQSDDGAKRDYHKEYSRKKHHTHVDSDYSYAEMRKIRGKRRESPRPEREKLRNEYDRKEKHAEKKSLKYDVRSDSSEEDDRSHSNDRGARKEKRSSRYY